MCVGSQAQWFQTAQHVWSQVTVVKVSKHRNVSGEVKNKHSGQWSTHAMFGRTLSPRTVLGTWDVSRGTKCAICAECAEPPCYSFKDFIRTLCHVSSSTCHRRARFMTPGVWRSVFHTASRDQHVLACGLRASVLVVPGVDPLWSHVGGVCRQLCNYAVSMTY